MKRTLEVNVYEGLTDFVARRKLKGIMTFPEAYHDVKYFDAQLYLVCGVVSDRTGKFYTFALMKWEKDLNDIKNKREREFVKKNLISPRDIQLKECYHYVPFDYLRSLCS